jgi:hypothetical protein
LNAAGRLGCAQLVVELLTTTNVTKARDLRGYCIARRSGDVGGDLRIVEGRRGKDITATGNRANRHQHCRDSAHLVSEFHKSSAPDVEGTARKAAIYL